MTAVDPDVRSKTPPIPEVVDADRPLAIICPYLAAAGGAWRSSTVAREHRCGAVSPPAILAAEKQRRLCLTPDYRTCTTYEAARAARPIAHDRAATLPRPVARTTPVILDHGRIAITVPAFRSDRSDRSTAQAALIVLLGIAFAAIVLARVAGGDSSGGASGVAATTQPTARATASQSSTARPTTSSGPAASAVPSGRSGASRAPATAKPSKAATRTYIVKSGDTLIGIAAHFGTTTKAIKQLNGMTDPSTLHIGQVLKIP
jgi:LysM repeat protein